VDIQATLATYGRARATKLLGSPTAPERLARLTMRLPPTRRPRIAAAIAKSGANVSASLAVRAAESFLSIREVGAHMSTDFGCSAGDLFVWPFAEKGKVYSIGTSEGNEAAVTVYCPDLPGAAARFIHGAAPVVAVGQELTLGDRIMVAARRPLPHCHLDVLDTGGPPLNVDSLPSLFASSLAFTVGGKGGPWRMNPWLSALAMLLSSPTRGRLELERSEGVSVLYLYLNADAFWGADRRANDPPAVSTLEPRGIQAGPVETSPDSALSLGESADLAAAIRSAHDGEQ